MNETILVVDDEVNIVELIKFNLELRGYEVECANDGEEALRKAKDIRPSLILLDLMLPIMDGSMVCKKIREDRDIKDTPIIMLTAKNMEKDKIYGLESGADDYITKPFSVKELMARVKAVMRRYSTIAQTTQQTNIVSGELVIDLQTYELFKKGKKIDLTRKEFELLKLLSINRGKVLTRNYLLDKVWGYEYFGGTRTVDVHIRHLRKKIEDDDKNPQYIETIRGVGYKMK